MKAQALVSIALSLVMTCFWCWAYHRRRDIKPFLFLGIFAFASLLLTYPSLVAVSSPHGSDLHNLPWLWKTIETGHLVLSFLTAGALVWLGLHALKTEQSASVNPPGAPAPVSRLAQGSLLVAVLALLSVAVIPFLSYVDEAYTLVPIVCSLIAVVLALAAILRIAFSHGRLKGTGVAITGLALGITTGTGWCYLLLKAIESLL